MKKRSRGKANSSDGDASPDSADCAIGQPDPASFKKVNNPIETKDALLRRLMSERKQLRDLSASPSITGGGSGSRRRLILDVVVVEAWDLPTLDGGRGLAPFCSVRMHGTEHHVETARGALSDPRWNQDLTFIYDEGDGLNASLLVAVYNAGGSRASRSKPTLLGAVSINPEQLVRGQMVDLWVDLRDPNSPSSWPWDRALEELAFLPAAPTTSYGFIHLKFHKTAKRDLGLLSFYGPPLNAIPLRVDVGDIVLFSDKKELAKQCIQIATSSKWDHMGMIVRMRGAKSLLLLESTLDGVAVFHVNERLDFYRTTCALGIRRLQLQRTAEMTTAMLDFVDKVVGKPYNKNFVELVRGKWGKNHQENVRSYFCSQLVAAAYQQMGLLSLSVPSTNFYPAHWEGGRKRLRLLNGARLSAIHTVPPKCCPDL